MKLEQITRSKTKIEEVGTLRKPLVIITEDLENWACSLQVDRLREIQVKYHKLHIYRQVHKQLTGDEVEDVLEAQENTRRLSLFC